MKNKTGILKFTEPLILITIWSGIFAAPLLLFQKQGSLIWPDVIRAWTGVMPFLLLFLINHFFLIPLLLFNNKKLMYLVSALVLLTAFSLTTFFLDKPRAEQHPPPPNAMRMPPPSRAQQNMLPKQPGNPPPPNRSPIPFPPFLNTIILSVLVIGFDTGLRMMVKWSKLEQEKTLLEKENVQNQLAFLRNQVSPHFFMNTLNNIHALIDVNTEEAKGSIIKLSKLMRHLLYESEVELTPLNKEVEFIRSYINLMKLRFSEKVIINLNIPGNLPDKSIPPLLFTSLIENAFKHGISYNSESFISISLSVIRNRLIFAIMNSIPEQKAESSQQGIGLDNTRLRLNLLYPDNYSLQLTENENIFTVKLDIPL